jgi:hypothetical protein
MTSTTRTRSSSSSTFAITMTRAWTRVYTWHMRPDLRERRRAEIESDLWECQQDPETYHGVSPDVQIVLRLLRGMPHDLCWRVEQADVTDTRTRVAGMAAVSATVAILIGALWMFSFLRPAALPVPQPEAWPFTRTLPPPPPIPPLVCSPAMLAKLQHPSPSR